VCTHRNPRSATRSSISASSAPFLARRIAAELRLRTSSDIRKRISIHGIGTVIVPSSPGFGVATGLSNMAIDPLRLLSDASLFSNFSIRDSREAT